MTDRERLVDIVCQAMQEGDCIGHCNYPPCNKVCAVVDELITHGVTVKEPQKPIAWEEIKDVIDDVYWVEFEGSGKPREASHWYLWSGVILTHAIVVGYVEPWGLEKTDYGKTWRCWAEKPTEEERKNAKWEE